jgi:hypothetical protein
VATSSAEDVPRTLDFLFSRNRLDVAVSRAMCLACIVASPRLLESRARRSGLASVMGMAVASSS